MDWFLKHTKKCPSCKCVIEKNEGCNHMTCKQCKHQFCWVCMGVWSEHGKGSGGYYSCNKYKGAEEARSKGEQSKAGSLRQKQQELQRFMHYFDRFSAHDNSRFLEVS